MKQTVIAYYMHEHERTAAQSNIDKPETTPAFVMGEADEAQIQALMDAGLIVEVFDGSREEKARQLIPATTTKGVRRRGLNGPDAFDPSIPNYYTVHLNGPVIGSLRKALEAQGVKLLEAIGPNTYKAFLDSEQAAEVRSMPLVSKVESYVSDEGPPAATQRPRGPGPADGLKRMLTYDVRIHRPEDLTSVLDWITSQGIEVEGSSRRKIRIVLREDSPYRRQLAALPAVQSIAEFIPPKPSNDRARALLGIDGNNPGPALPQTGKGQIVGVADTGLDADHPDFKGRVKAAIALGRPGDPSDIDGHGTHVAGSAVGDGAASGGQFKGIAPEAKLYFQSLLDDEGYMEGLPLELNDLYAAPYDAGVRVHNNSWGSDTNGVYTFNSSEVDEFVCDNRDMLIVFAAGNEGVGVGTPTSLKAEPKGVIDSLSIASPGTAKNALTVGASRSDRITGGRSEKTYSEVWPKYYPDPPIGTQKVSGDPESLAAFSSRGPCDDQRVKPDLVAPGTDIVSTKSSSAPIGDFWGPVPGHDGKYGYMGGTSMAAPIVTGCAALVRQYFIDDRNHEPSAALLKATLINGTRWLSGQDATAEHEQEPEQQNLPNFHQGFGCVDMLASIPNDSAADMHLAFSDDWQSDELSLFVTGELFEFMVTVADTRELRLCLVWTDAPGRSLQNNLNLLVESQVSGTKWVGNADVPRNYNVLDTNNNVEVIRIDAPPAGKFKIQVVASNLLYPPQDFALVVTGDLQSDLNIAD